MNNKPSDQAIEAVAKNVRDPNRSGIDCILAHDMLLNLAAEREGLLARIEELKTENVRHLVTPEGWSGWACMFKDRLPRLYGAREIAEANCYGHGEDRLLFLVEASPATSIPPAPGVKS